MIPPLSRQITRLVSYTAFDKCHLTSYFNVLLIDIPRYIKARFLLLCIFYQYIFENFLFLFFIFFFPSLLASAGQRFRHLILFSVDTFSACLSLIRVEYLVLVQRYSMRY